MVALQPTPIPIRERRERPLTHPRLRYYDSQYAMEPITHFLTGACIGRAGLNRKTAYATLAAVLAAEAADLDVFWGFAGPVEEPQASSRHHAHLHRRALCCCCGRRGNLALSPLGRAPPRASTCKPPRRRARRATASQPQPVRWLWVYLSAFIASLSHILLDWTNNYGVRPFFPFNPRWYEGSFVFIAEPVLWVLLVAALIIPWLLGLADREIGVERTPFRGRGWAIFALSRHVSGLVPALGRARPGRGLILNNPDHHRARRPLAVEPYPSIRFAGTPLSKRRTTTNSPKSTPAPATSTATRRPTCSTSRRTRPPSKPPSERTGQGLSGLGPLGRRAGHRPGADHRHRPAAIAARPHLDHRRVHRPALRLRFSRNRQRPSALRPGRRCLHHRQPRRSRPGDGRPRTECSAELLY